jgi:hypothetical protein
LSAAILKAIVYATQWSALIFLINMFTHDKSPFYYIASMLNWCGEKIVECSSSLRDSLSSCFKKQGE